MPPSHLYKVTQYELHTCAYVVRAESPADAIITLWDGRATEHGESQLAEIGPDAYGMPIDNHAALAAELQQRGYLRNFTDVIAGIESVAELPEPAVPEVATTPATAMTVTEALQIITDAARRYQQRAQELARLSEEQARDREGLEAVLFLSMPHTYQAGESKDAGAESKDTTHDAAS